MEFPTAAQEKRPVRLSEETRAFAWESMHGKYGDEAVKNDAVCMDEVPGYAEMTAEEKYNAMVAEICAKAPLRVCPQESVCGAATLGHAILHRVPAKYHGEMGMVSVSHVTLGFDRVLRTGVNALEDEVREKLSRAKPESPEALLWKGMLCCIDGMHVLHSRYLNAVRETRPELFAALEKVPFLPPQSFREALQSLWFQFAFTRLLGNWPGIGRIDQMLGGYLKADLQAGRLTLDQARELLAGFFIKGCEWICSDENIDRSSGDAQHYQNIVLGGIDAQGNDVTNEVTYLVLDVVEELGISDFPITVRIRADSPERLLTRVAEVMRHGGGVIAVYNEPLILRSLMDFGYSQDEARRFANDGCWEVQVPGKTCFGYLPFDSLRILQQDVLRLNTESPAHFDSFEELYAAYLQGLDAFLEQQYQKHIGAKVTRQPDGSWEWHAPKPQEWHAMVCPLIALYTDGCIQSGKPYFSGGPRYTVLAPHIGGAPDTGNSLLAIDRLVFREKKISFDALMKLMQTDWAGAEELRRYALNQYTYYGNDDDEADRYTVRVIDDFAALTRKRDGRCPIRVAAGVSTFGRQIEWMPNRTATPFGKHQGEILSGNTSPTPGTDLAGVTALIRSYCKLNLHEQQTGAALDVKIHPTAIRGENGVRALVALMRSFCTLGGFFMQIDVFDVATLLAAQKHPEDYKTLSVRVSGWNARFVTLNEEWQQMVIERQKGTAL